MNVLDFNTIKIIIGLGNPESQYENTYHNIGKLAVKYIIKKLKNNITQNKKEKLFDYSVLEINQNKFYLILPKTYMNESGKALLEVLKKFKAHPQNILIIQDDSDIYIGKYKYVFGRNSAGHHGIDSIFNILKSKNFWRLRIGIRPKNSLKQKALDFVLKEISPEHKKIFYGVFDKLTEKLTENVLP
jgi:PTH1 family peptidyl-tRNA hydrolase